MVDKDGKELNVGDKVLVEMEVAGDGKLPLDIRLEQHIKGQPSLAFCAAAAHVVLLGPTVGPAVVDTSKSILAGPAMDVIELVPALDKPAEVEALIAEEEAGKNRSTVLKALRDRLATFPK